MEKKLDQWLASDIPAIGRALDFFSYDVFRTENRTHHLPDDERMRYVLRNSSWFNGYLSTSLCLASSGNFNTDSQKPWGEREAKTQTGKGNNQQ